MKLSFCFLILSSFLSLCLCAPQSYTFNNIRSSHTVNNHVHNTVNHYIDNSINMQGANLNGASHINIGHQFMPRSEPLRLFHILHNDSYKIL